MVGADGGVIDEEEFVAQELLKDRRFCGKL